MAISSLNPGLLPVRQDEPHYSHGVSLHEELWPVCQQVVPSPRQQLPQGELLPIHWNVHCCDLVVAKQQIESSTAANSRA